MNDSLCMLLADCYSDDERIATIFRHFPEWPKQVPLFELGKNIGICKFKRFQSENFVGALVTNEAKSEGIVLWRPMSATRDRFTIAHELGHYVIPSHTGDRNCTAADLRQTSVSDKYKRQEAEANAFAANLLMYKPRFTQDMRRMGEIDIAQILKLADLYGTSRESTANRYVELSDEPIAVVYSYQGKVRYSKRAQSFPYLSLRRGQELPPNSFSAVVEATNPVRESDWREIPRGIWLDDNCSGRSAQIFEQTMKSEKGHQLTLLHLDAQIDEDDEQEDLELEKSWHIGFKR